MIGAQMGSSGSIASQCWLAGSMGKSGRVAFC